MMNGAKQPAICACFTCIDKPELGILNPTRYMVVCATCGNKRCPAATSHEYECTNSNEPGQPGSRYKLAKNDK